MPVSILNPAETNAQASGATNTVTYEASAGNNRKLIIGISAFLAGATVSVTSVVCDGQAATLIVTDTQSGGGSNRKTFLYEVLETDISTGAGLSCVVTFANSGTVSICAVMVIQDAVQGTPGDPEDEGSQTGSLTNSSITLTSSVGSMQIDTLTRFVNENTTAGAGQSEEWDLFQTAIRGFGSTQNLSGTQDMTASWTTSTNFVYVAASFAFETPDLPSTIIPALVKANALVENIIFPSIPVVAFIPEQRPILASPGLAEYKVRLKDQDGEPVAEFDTWRSLFLTHKVNDRGKIRFEINGKDKRINLFQVDSQIEVWRRNLIVGLDWYIEWEGFFRTSDDKFLTDDSNSFIAHGFSYLDLARRAYIMYRDGSTGADKNGVGETVIKEYGAENIGPTALITNGRVESDNIMQGLTIQADGGNGTNWQGQKSYKPLLKTIQDIALKTGVDFDLIGTGAALYEFQVYNSQR